MNWRIAIALVVLSGGLVAAFAAFWAFTVDDSFITYRYAEHLASGQGLRWNPDGELVEGYTAFLWMVLLSAVSWAGLGVVEASKVGGALCALATLLVVMRLIGQRVRVDVPGRALYPVLGGVWLALTPELAWHAVSGMETAAFTLLVTLFGAQWLQLDDARGPRTRGLAITALLLGLMRPDGNILAAVTFLLAPVFRNDARSIAFWRTVFFLYVLPGAVYFIVRSMVFGQLFPAPFAVKVVSDLPGQSGWDAVRAFCRHHAIIGVLAISTLLRGRPGAWPLALAMLAFLGFYLVPTHIMGYGFRFLVPLLPLLIACAVTSVAEWITVAQAQRRVPLAVAVLALLLAVDGARLGRAWPRSLDIATRYADGLRAAHIALGDQLRILDPSGDSLVALEDAGAISYRSGWQSLDLLGLNDATIAFRGFDVERVVNQGPDVVVLVSRRADRYQAWGWNNHDLHQALLDDGLALANVLTFRPDDYYLHVLARPGQPAWTHLRRTLPLGPGPSPEAPTGD